MARQGLALIHRPAPGTANPGATEPLGFACSPESHQICVIDRRGRLLEVFGEQGGLPGQFDHPSDVIVVSPRFQGEEHEQDELHLVAVADRGNHRIQVFEPEGQLVAIIEGAAGAADGETASDRAGWPFFHLDPHPRFGDPVRLEWDDPALVVIDAAGTRTRIDLAAALLPSFDEWLAAASTPLLLAAHHHFRHKVRRDMLAAPLAAIETALGEAWLSAGDVEATARLWSLSWPADLTGDAREAHAARRLRASSVAAFRLGGIARVTPVRTAIRQSLGAFAVLPQLARDHGGRESREAS